jgi:TIR domain
MADIFLSFKTSDTPRVQAMFDGLRSEGFSVFWSNDIPVGAPNYQAVIRANLDAAHTVVVVWTAASVHSSPVTQEAK